METPAPRSIQLEVICLRRPQTEDANQHTEFGLQDRNQQLIIGTPLPDGALRYRCSVTAKLHAQGDAPDFAGPFVHGKPGARFLYLSLRQRGGTDWIWRIKIPLASITSEQIEAAAHPARVLAARVQGDRSGTVPLLGAGWMVEDEEN